MLYIVYIQAFSTSEFFVIEKLFSKSHPICYPYKCTSAFYRKTKQNTEFRFALNILEHLSCSITYFLCYSYVKTKLDKDFIAYLLFYRNLL